MLKTSDLYESSSIFLRSDKERALRLAQACLNLRSGVKKDVRMDAILNLIGSCMTKTDPVGNAKEAIRHFKEAADIDPTQPQYQANLALAYMYAGDPNTGMRIADEILDTWPDNEEGIVKLANAYMHKGQHNLANITWRGFSEKYPSAFNTMALGLNNLLLADIGGEMKLDKYHIGVRQFNQRHELMGMYLDNHFSPIRDFTPIRSGKFQVVLEQGLGDCVMMIPYLQLMASHVDELEIVSRDQDAAIDIYQSGGFFPRNVHFIRKSALDGALMEPGVARCWLFDLLDLDTPDQVCSPMAPMGDTFGKIGICWRGNPEHPNDPFRSMSFRVIEPFIEEFGPRLFNLQSNLKPEEATFLKSAGVEIDGKIVGYPDLSRSILNLSCVVTVDTFISHMTGLLGVPCYTMLPVNVDWRWGITSDTTPWYSNHRLFRQLKCQDWSPVLEEISNELRS